MAVMGLGAIAVVGHPRCRRCWPGPLTLGVPDDVATEQRELVTFLLIFFLPQVVLYAGATVATGVLHAKRRFMAAAAAPMASTVVMVISLLAFRAVAGEDPGLDLSLGNRFLLVAAGTGGVIAFTGVLVGRLPGCRASGCGPGSARSATPGSSGSCARRAGASCSTPRRACSSAGRSSSAPPWPAAWWPTRAAWVFFLAPYAIFSQPIQVAILPELVVEARDVGLARYATSARWAVERIALPVLPDLGGHGGARRPGHADRAGGGGRQRQRPRAVGRGAGRPGHRPVPVRRCS